MILFRVALLVFVSLPVLAQGDHSGAQLFATNCAGCHGSDGKGSDRGPSIATMPSTLARSEADLISIVRNGISGRGMPPFPQLGEQGGAAVVRYLRTLQGVTGTLPVERETGDAVAGRALYFGKGQCASCHMVNGEGGFIASEMTTYGQNRAASAILQAIVTPDTQVGQGSRVIEVRTNSGQRLMGVLRFEDNLNLGLQTTDGRYHFLTRSALAEVKYTDHTLMPHDYGTRLSAKELDDLVSFLVVTGKHAPAESKPTGRGKRGGN